MLRTGQCARRLASCPSRSCWFVAGTSACAPRGSRAFLTSRCQRALLVCAHTIRHASHCGITPHQVCPCQLALAPHLMCPPAMVALPRPAPLSTLSHLCACAVAPPFWFPSGGCTPIPAGWLFGTPHCIAFVFRVRLVTSAHPSRFVTAPSSICTLRPAAAVARPLVTPLLPQLAALAA